MNAFKSASKGKKISVILSTVLALIAVGLAIFSVAFTPHDKEISAADGAEYTTLVALSENELIYTTKNGVYAVGENEEVTKSFDIRAYTQDKISNVGDITYSYHRNGSDNVWMATTTSSGGYLFRLNTDLEVLDYTEYNGALKGGAESDDGNYFYMVYGINSANAIKKYSAKNLSTGVLKTGYVYDMLGVSGGYRLFNFSTFRVLGVAIKGDVLYIVHPNGIIYCNTDLEVNETDISMESPVIVSSSEFDIAKYCKFISAGTLRGFAYDKENSRFYFTQEDEIIHYIDTANIKPTRISVMQDNTVERITLAGKPLADTSSLLYDERSNCAFVLYQSSDSVSKIDFNEQKLSYTVKMDFGISYVLQNGNGSKAYYFFFNENRSSSKLLKVCDVSKSLFAPTLKILLIVAIVVGVVCVIWSILSFLAIYKKGYDKKLKQTWRAVVKNRWIYILLIVPIVLLIAFCYYETFASIITSFFDYTTDNPTYNWNNFKNYKDIFTDTAQLKSFANMLFFLVFDLFTSIVPPIIFAFFLITMKSKKYSAFTRTMLFIPGVIPGIAGLLIWSSGIFGEYGVISTIVRFCGGEPINLLASSSTARWALVFMGFPYVGGYLIFYGAMMNIPSSYHEAAELEGIGIFGRLFKIDIPLIAPQIKYIFVTMFIHSVQNFARTYTTVGDVLSKNVNVITPVHYMYRNVVSGNYGVASAYATLIFIFLFVATVLNFRKKKSELGAD